MLVSWIHYTANEKYSDGTSLSSTSIECRQLRAFDPLIEHANFKTSTPPLSG